MLSLLMNSSAARGTPPGPHSAKLECDRLGVETAALRPLIRGVVAKVLGQGPNDPDVEDCTHEALRRALEGHGRLRESEPLRPWVIGIAKHVALDALRARKRHRERHSEARASEHDDDDGRPSAIDRVADVSPGPLENLERARRDDAVREVMRTMPDGTREALMLFHVEGLGYQEISSRLGVPLGTVATWVTRGRKAMATAMAQRDETIMKRKP
jgi:RNA polymerase sigma factor (sigma-70 family)